MSDLTDLMKFDFGRQNDARYRGAHFAERVLREAMGEKAMEMLMCLVRHDEILCYKEQSQVNLDSYEKLLGRAAEGRFCLSLTKSNLHVYGRTPESAMFRMLAALLDGAWFPLTLVNSGYPVTQEKKELSELIHELRHFGDDLNLVDGGQLADRLEKIMRDR